VPRIFIDCARIRLEGIPTGIPRVVANYINFGIDWAKKNGYEIVLAVPYDKGLAQADYAISTNTKTAFVPLKKPPFATRATGFIKHAMQYLLIRLKLFIFHLLMAIGLVLPIRHKSADQFASGVSNKVLRLLDIATILIDKAHWKSIDIPIRQGDMLFCPAYWHDVKPEIYKSIRARGCKIFFLVHDVLPITHAQYYAAPWRDEFRENVISSYSYVEKFFCVSDFTRRSLVALAEKETGKHIQASLAYNGFDPLSKNTLPRMSEKFKQLCDQYSTFLIVVGTIEPKKQHLYILDQLSELWDEGYDLPLFIIGRRGWLDQGIIERIEMHPKLDKNFYWIDDMTDADLIVAYRRAKFLLFASETEGFGLPLIEALSNRLPVIVYDTPVSREIVGDLGIYFDRKQNHLKDLLIKYSDEQQYSDFKESLRFFDWPEWKNQVDLVFDEIKKITTESNDAYQKNHFEQFPVDSKIIYSPT